MFQRFKRYLNEKREKRLNSLKEELDREAHRLDKQLVLRQDMYEQGYVDGYNEAVKQIIEIHSQSKN